VPEPPGGGPFGIGDFAGQDGPDPVRVPGFRGRHRAGEWASGLFQRAQRASQVEQGGPGEASAGFAAVLQARRCLDAQEQRAEQGSARTLAGGPPADDDVLAPLVLDLQPPWGTAPGQVGRVQLLEHHTFEAVLEAGGQDSLPGSGEARRHARIRARQFQVLQQGAPLRVRNAEQVPSVDAHDVERQVGHWHGSGPGRFRCGRAATSGPARYSEDLCACRWGWLRPLVLRHDERAAADNRDDQPAVA
jgi:hypothetical protein